MLLCQVMLISATDSSWENWAWAQFVGLIIVRKLLLLEKTVIIECGKVKIDFEST